MCALPLNCRDQQKISAFILSCRHVSKCALPFNCRDGETSHGFKCWRKVSKCALPFRCRDYSLVSNFLILTRVLKCALPFNAEINPFNLTRITRAISIKMCSAI